jgi:hypothetical protein
MEDQFLGMKSLSYGAKLGRNRKSLTVHTFVGGDIASPRYRRQSTVLEDILRCFAAICRRFAVVGHPDWLRYCPLFVWISNGKDLKNEGCSRIYLIIRPLYRSNRHR